MRGRGAAPDPAHGGGDYVPPRRKRRGRRLLAALFLALLVTGAALAAVGAFLWVNCGLEGCPDVSTLRGYMPDEASQIVDRTGQPLAKLYLVRRTVVPLDSIPDYVADAFIAVEDRRFWEHDGVDWRRIPGAAWRNLNAWDVQEGFSTITMQLARNLFPEALPARERTIWRKLGEMKVAREIEDRYDKREILELYLNQIYFGSGAWGIEAAAREFFGKSASQLTLAEGALLAGLPAAPSAFNPRADSAAALARRAVVLRRMVAAGLIDETRAAEAAAEPLELSRGERDVTRRAPYFVEAVRQEMERELGRALYTQGLTIHTTLDPQVQRAAETELERQLRRIEAGAYGRYTGARYRPGGDEAVSTPYIQGAVVVMDLATGGVLALVGGRDFDASKYDRARQARRQPGSAFKPFVYAAAVAEGYPPTLRLADTPYTLPLSGGRFWTPSNYGGSYAGVVTMRNALRHSRNAATIRLADRVGLGSVIRMARRLGIHGQLPEVPSVVLGAGEVTLLELVTAYTAFATLGHTVEPRLVTHVEDRDGRVRWRSRERSRQVLDPAAAFIMTDLLRDVVDRGTGTAVRAVGYTGPAAGKTGTTNDATDTWFIGFTPETAAGVWIGFDVRRTIVPGATGGQLAAPVWGRIMRVVGGRAQGWPVPDGVVRHRVDAFGYVVPDGCPPLAPTHEEYFVRGTVPLPDCEAYYSTPRDSAGIGPYPQDLLGEEVWRRRMRERLERGGDSVPDFDYDRDRDFDSGVDRDTDRGLDRGMPGTAWPGHDEPVRAPGASGRRPLPPPPDSLLGEPVQPRPPPTGPGRGRGAGPDPGTVPAPSSTEPGGAEPDSGGGGRRY